MRALDLARDTDAETLATLNEAVDRLTDADPRCAEIVRLRLFAGLDEGDVAAVLGLSNRTVRREWTFARAFLAEHFRDGESAS